VSKLKFDEDAVISPMQIEMTKVQETIEYTVEIVVNEFLILLPLY